MPSSAMMKEITTNGIKLSCGSLLPVSPMDPAFIEAFAEVPGPNDLFAIALFPQVAPMGLLTAPPVALPIAVCECDGS